MVSPIITAVHRLLLLFLTFFKVNLIMAHGLDCAIAMIPQFSLKVPSLKSCTTKSTKAL